MSNFRVMDFLFITIGIVIGIICGVAITIYMVMDKDDGNKDCANSLEVCVNHNA